MIQLYRARLLLIGALLAAIAIVALELPLGELFHQRSELSAVSSQLAAVSAHNSSLSADIAALSSNSAIAAIAHEEYGLIRPGQRSYVILPAAGSSSGDLASPSIPPQDLVAAAPDSAGAAAAAPGAPQPAFWSRFASHLAFWRWAF